MYIPQRLRLLLSASSPPSFFFFFKVYHLVQISPLVRLFSNVSCKQASFSASTYRAETRSSIPFNFFLGFPFRFPLNCLNAADSWEFRAFTDTPRRARRDEITLWAIVKGKKKKKKKKKEEEKRKKKQDSLTERRGGKCFSTGDSEGRKRGRRLA